jgi:PAS domain S-box-containing protein
MPNPISLAPPVPLNEDLRLKALRSYYLLDSFNTISDKTFDHLCELSKDVCRMPMAAISLVDETREWFKTQVGFELKQIARDKSCSTYVVSSNEVLIVEDLLQDERFAQNAFALAQPPIRFYAGFPLQSAEGYVLGALMVMDHSPRVLTSNQIEQLKKLASTVMFMMELYRKANYFDLSSLFFKLTKELHCLVRRDGYFMKVNPTWTQILGWSEADLKAKPFNEFIHPEDRVAAWKQFDQVARKGAMVRYSTRVMHQNGSVVWLEWSMTFSKEYALVLGTARDMTQEKAFQDELKRTANQLTALFESMTEGILLLNEKGEAVQFNATALQILGLTSQELLGHSPVSGNFSIRRPNGEPFPREEMPGLVALKTGKSIHHLPMIIQKKDGSASWISTTARPLFIPGQDKPYSAISTFSDLSDLQKAQMEIKNTMDFVPTGIVRMNKEGNITYVNDTFVKILGQSREELLNRNWKDLIEGQDRRLVVKEWQQSVLEKRAFEFTYPYKHNFKVAYIYIKGQELKDIAGTLEGYLGSIQDITSLKTVEQLNEYYKVALDQASIVAFTDVHGKITYANEMFCKVSGYSKEELIGQDHRILNSHKMGREFFKNMWATIASGKPWNGEICNRAKDGHEYWVSTNIIPYMGANGKIDKYIAIRKDITVEKRQQLELQGAYKQAEAATRAKSDFLSTMSHEIRTPLNGVIGMASLLVESQLTKDQMEIADAIIQSGKSLLMVINDVLDFSKIEAGKMQLEETEFDGGSYFVELLKPFQLTAHSKGLEFELQVSGNEFCLIGDPGRIGQILSNLVGNALKFTREGKVIVRLQCQRLGLDSNLKISVSDTGIGIPADVKSQLFQPFTQAEQSTTRKYGGTGLGLSICKRLVEMMNGSIGVESEYGKGATFFVDLQLKTGKAIFIQPHAGKSHEQRLQFQGRVLVAEDNPTNQKVIDRMLAKLGLKAHLVANGKEAVEAMKEAQYDLILMDCQMPEMDGYEATKVIRALPGLGKSIPIIALTANVVQGDDQRCLDAGMNRYLSKPVDLAILESALSEYLMAQAA